MLNQQDIKSIGKLIDEKVVTDIAAIQGRIANLESGKITKIEFIEIKNILNRVEKRITAIEGRLIRIEDNL